MFVSMCLFVCMSVCCVCVFVGAFWVSIGIKMIGRAVSEYKINIPLSPPRSSAASICVGVHAILSEGGRGNVS